MNEGYWLEEPASGVPETNEWLNEAELAILGGLALPKRHAEWRLGRWVAKRALSYYWHSVPEPRNLRRIELRAATSGAPQVYIDGVPVPVAISISHSHGIGLCAVSRYASALGCDIERVEPRSDGFLDYFTPVELAQIEQYTSKQKELLVTVLWSAKESGLKALRTGLRADTRSLDVTPVGFDSQRFGDAVSSLNKASTPWRPLVLRSKNTGMLQGWWQCVGDSVRTFVATPTIIQPPASLRKNRSC